MSAAATPAATFDAVKSARNLMFEREEYVDDICDMENGPMSLATLRRWDKREEGALGVGDEAFDVGTTMQVFSLAEKSMQPLQSFFTPGRPLVMTFGSFS